MQLRASSLLSYPSFLWTVEAKGIEGNKFPLLNSTAFRLRMEEPVTSLEFYVFHPEVLVM